MEKWLQLLKELAPRMTRAAVMFNPQTAPYAEYYLQPLNKVAPKIGVKTFTAPVRSASDIEDVINKLGAAPGSGLITMTDSFIFVNRKLIYGLAARNKVPAMYYVGSMAEEGGLISYGVEYHDLFRRSATYVDRILRGAKPADLPVEQPSKFELFINQKTAKALGLTIPQTILVRADQVIE
jgi:putative ABC transport system substrate-binding protein